MNKQHKEKQGVYWGFVLLGAMMLLVSGIMIVQGIDAQKTEAIIPGTTKHGPMTGLESIITGIITGVAGIAFLGYEVHKVIMKRQKKLPNTY